MSATPSAVAFQQPTSAATEFQALRFFVQQRLLRVQTVTLVQVQAVHGGGVGPIGTVDVLPLVGQVDGAGNVVPHQTIFGRPYSRIQAGGVRAVILDPAPGDIGVMVFASRDLSSVIANGASGKQKVAAPPGSARYFNYADGLYLFTCVGNQTPTEYLEFVPSGGIRLQTAGTFTVSAGSINLNGATISGSGEVTDGLGKILGTHTHGGVQTGGGTSGPPT
jgi:GpV Apex motif